MEAGRRRVELLIIAGLVALWPSAAQQFDSKHWEFRSEISVQQPDRVNLIDIDRQIYARSRSDLGDLRVTRNSQEIPYVLEALRGTDQAREAPANVINRGAVSAGVQLTLDARGVERHSLVRLGTDEINFRQRVIIETSDDNSFWQIAREDGYIFDFSQGDTHVSVLDVSYPVSTRRYIRITVEGWKKPDALKDARLVYREAVPTAYELIEVGVPAITQDAADKVTLAVMDLGRNGLPHERVRLDVAAGYFHRAVTIEASEDGKSWRSVGHGTIFRVTGEAQLELVYPERHERYLRLRIHNADNPPVNVARVYVETVKRRLKISAYPITGEYLLYFGNPNARPPQYDLGIVLAKQGPAAESVATLREWGRNPGYESPPGKSRPWTERYPGLLYSVLGAATIGMLWMTLRFLRKVQHH